LSGEQDHEDEDQHLINNRQNGRRRGRGGGGPRSPNQGPQGNRQDNRSRGNAAQLLEKYKSMARDAQLQGDRVQSEYWLQFADHYYRVLNENRARFEEQRRSRDDYGSDEDEGQDEAMAAESEESAEREEPVCYAGGADDGGNPNNVPRRGGGGAGNSLPDVLAGSAAELDFVRSLLAYQRGSDPDEVSDLGAATLAPFLRGKNVMLR